MWDSLETALATTDLTMSMAFVQVQVTSSTTDLTMSMSFGRVQVTAPTTDLPTEAKMERRQEPTSQQSGNY